MRFPQLFLLLAALFVADFFFVDPLPFVDEIILGVLTVMTAMWKRDRKQQVDLDQKPAEKNITPQ